MSDDTHTIRSYQRIFRPDRRIYQIDGRRLPVPGGVPLEWLGWAFAVAGRDPCPQPALDPVRARARRDRRRCWAQAHTAGRARCSARSPGSWRLCSRACCWGGLTGRFDC